MRQSTTATVSRDDLNELVSDLLINHETTPEVPQGPGMAAFVHRGPTTPEIRGGQRSVMLVAEMGDGTLATLRRSAQMAASAMGLSFKEQGDDNARVPFGNQACTFATLSLDRDGSWNAESSEFMAAKVNQVIQQLRDRSRADGMTMVVLEGIERVPAEAADRIAKEVGKIQGEGHPFVVVAVGKSIPGAPTPPGIAAFLQSVKSIQVTQDAPSQDLADRIRARRALMQRMDISLDAPKASSPKP